LVEPRVNLQPSSQQRHESPPVEWRQRCDLILRPQDSGYWIVKDPLSLSYTMLSEQEMAVLRNVNGTRSITDLLGLLNTAWPQREFTREDVEDFLAQLIQNQLVVRTSTSRVPISPRSTTPVSATTGFRIGSLLRFQMRLIDPTPFLNRLEPLIRRLFSRESGIVLMALVIVALAIVFLRFDQLTRNLPGPWDFFGPDNLLLLLATFVVVKTLHELGHAFAARRFGAECHEAGVMLMMFTPLLYTNVTDAWILDRRSRLMITAAGMLVELALASVATILWFAAAPGIFKAILANVMVLCTVGTIVFNGNPLLRFDGYFLLTDLAGLPNLSQRASLRLQQLWSFLLLGRTEVRTDRESPFVLAYAVCSGIYRVSLSFAILLMLYHLFDHWNLRIIGLALTMMAAVSMIIMPLLNSFIGLLVEILHQKQRGYLLMRSCLILALLAAGLFIALPHSVIVPCIVEPAGRPIYATISGELKSSADYGQILSPGDVIAVTSDLKLLQQLTHLQGEVKVLQTRVRVYELDRTGTQSALLPEARKMLDSAIQRVDQFEAELERLATRSPSSGVLMPPRATPLSDDASSLNKWHGCPLDPHNLGAFLEEGTLLGTISDPATVELILPVTSAERQLLREGQHVEFQPTGNPNLTFSGSIIQMPTLESTEIPQELTAANLLPPLTAAKPGDDSRRWQVICQAVVPQGTTPPRSYSTGHAKISVEPASLFTRFLRFFNLAFE
jgi:putative peptide zinc metalloprotease protein